MITFLVGVLSLAGGVLLEAWRRRIADRRWMLERRHEAYLDFVRAHGDVRRELFAYELTRTEEARENALAAYTRMDDAHLVIRLIGSVASTALAQDLYAHEAEHYNALVRDAPAKERAAASLAVGIRADRFVAELRDELPHERSFRWSLWGRRSSAK